MERSQPARNLVDQATGKVNGIFRGNTSWGNDSEPLSDPIIMKISGGAALMMTQQDTTFATGVNSPNAVTTAASLNRMMMGGTLMQQNAGVGGNGLRGAAEAAAKPKSATDVGRQKFLGSGIMVWCTMTAAVKHFGPESTTQEFSKKLLKW